MAIDRVLRAQCDHPHLCGQRIYRLGASYLREEMEKKGWLTLGGLHFCGPGDSWDREYGNSKDYPDHAKLFAGGEHRPKHRRAAKNLYGDRPWIPGCACGWSLPGADCRSSARADQEWLGEHVRPVVFGMKTAAEETAELRAWHEQRQAKLEEVRGDGQGDHANTAS